MAEVVFARNFLATLEARPLKLSSDHVEDPKNFPARAPFTLPKMPRPFNKPQNLAPGQERSVTVQLKSLRNPPVDVKLTSQPLNTSVLDLKTSVSEKAHIPVEKMKLLYNKKPIPDSKVLKELIGDAESSIDFSIMVVGGAAAVVVPSTEAGQSAVESQPKGADALETDAFWDDLKGFLMQRLKDESQAAELSKTWRSQWKSSR